MRRLAKVAFLSLIVVVLVAADSNAQDKKKKGGRRGGRGGFGGQRGGFGRGMRGGAARLLRRENVQKELKITDDQKKKIDGAFAKLIEMIQELRELPREERREAFQKIGELRTKAGKTAMALLKKEQKERLDQLVLQQSGSGALQQEELQKKLGLSKKQTRKISSLVSDHQEKQRDMFSNRGDGGFEGMREKMQEMREKLDKDVLGVLTKKQSEKFEKMKGKKFKFESRRRRSDVRP